MTQPGRLVYETPPPPNPGIDHHQKAHDKIPKPNRRAILDPDTAKEIIEFRDREFPLGFRNVKELLELQAFAPAHLDILQRHFRRNALTR